MYLLGRNLLITVCYESVCREIFGTQVGCLCMFVISSCHIFHTYKVSLQFVRRSLLVVTTLLRTIAEFRIYESNFNKAHFPEQVTSERSRTVKKVLVIEDGTGACGSF